jgi:2-polyprenyl-6-methoxyphenol hydroxylase-like FAD-dependent oxidoreductase
VIAADGARSFLRRAVGIELRGADDVMTGHTTLFHAPLWEVAGPHRHLIYSTAHGSLIPTGPGDRWLLGHQQSHGAVEQIRAAAGVPDLPVRVVRTRAFSAAAQLAERWRSGPVFLVGDAAHRVTPRGGTGLNLALHDGHDLGWKLAWVLNGWAGPELLDSYEAERRPVAEHTVARSADPNGSLRPVEEARVDLGGRIPHVATEQGSTLDLLGPGLTLFAARGETDWRALVYVDAPVTVRLLEPVAARALGVHPGTAMLVRPDGHASEYVSARPVGGRLGTSRADREVIP